MPTVYTEAEHAAEFILWEQGGSLSRENGVLASGEDLVAGTVLMDNGAGKLVEYDGGTDSEAAGILIYSTDASAADVAVSYLARMAEVNVHLITYPTGELVDTTAALAALNIRLR